jgi:hypothetical protein
VYFQVSVDGEDGEVGRDAERNHLIHQMCNVNTIIICVAAGAGKGAQEQHGLENDF